MLSFHHRPPALPKPKEFRHVAGLRILALLLLMIFMTVVVATAFFIYDQVFRTFDRVQMLLLLDTDLHTEAIDFVRLNKVRTAWEEKRHAPAPSSIRDPFYPIIPPGGQP